MAGSYSVLGQSFPAGNSLTDLYTVPASTQVTISSFVACNQSGSAVHFRMSVAPAGAADEESQYLYFDVTIPANDTFAATLGITLGAADVVRVQSDSGTVSFSLFGVELT